MPWLRTVIKHEAFALRRQRERHSPVTDDGELADSGTAPSATHDQAERWERLRHGAEAISRLKPQELRALLLKAEGYSYREICEITGWTYTKVNRCLTEGRRAFSERLEEIHGGRGVRAAGRQAVGPRRRRGERRRPRAAATAPAHLPRLSHPAARVPRRARAAWRRWRRRSRSRRADGSGLRGLLESLVGAASTRRPRWASAPRSGRARPPARRSPRWPRPRRHWPAGEPPWISWRCPRRARGRPQPTQARGAAGGDARPDPRPAAGGVHAHDGARHGPHDGARPRSCVAAARPRAQFDPVAAQAPAQPAAATSSPADAAFAPGGAPSGGSPGGGGGEFAP